jgi:hypothetical protein
VALDGKRKTIRIGKMTMKQATAFKVKVEALVGKSISGVVDDEVSRLLAGLDSVMHRRSWPWGWQLRANANGPANSAPCLGAFLESYIAGRTDLKESTRTCPPSVPPAVH